MKKDVKNAARYRLRHRYREDLRTRLSCFGCEKKRRTFHSFHTSEGVIHNITLLDLLNSSYPT